MEQTYIQVKSFDAGDLTDAHSLAECHLKWASMLIRQIGQNLKNQEADNMDFIEFAEYTVNTYVENHKAKSEMYEAEWRSQPN